MADLDRNSVDGARAMDEEELRHLEQEFVQSHPLLRYSPHLREMMLAIQRGSQAVWRPSEAVSSSGTVHASDLNNDGFLSNMEGFRQEHMVSPESRQGSNDAEDARNFGKEGISPGQEWLSEVHKLKHERGSAIEENAPNQQAMEQEVDQPGDAPWLRRYPAAGRFAARRQDAGEKLDGFFERGGMERFRRGTYFARRQMGDQNS